MSPGGGVAGTGPDEGPIRVLHVDDDPQLLALAATLLERERPDVSVTSAEGAARGLETLESAPFDCVVSDYDMPGADGLEFLEAVREEYPDLPFILFTGKGSEEIASDAISAGVTDYIQKSGRSERYAMLANRIGNAVDRYRAERAVEATRRWHQRLVEESTDVILVVDPDGTVRYTSPSVEGVLGYDPAETTGRNAFEFVHPDDRDAVEEGHAAVVAGDESVPPVRFRCEHEDGGWVVLESRSRNLLDDPTIDGVVVYVRDVSGQRARERELTRYESVVEATGDVVYALDADGRFTFVNEAYESLTGYAAEEVLGEYVSITTSEEDIQRGRGVIRELLRDDEKTHQTYEIDLYTRDGERVPVENHVSLLTDEEGSFVGSTGVLRDLSARKDRERDLERYARIVGAIGDGVYALDREGRLVEYNEYLAELTGYDDDELEGASVALWYDDEDVERFERAIRALLAGEAEGNVQTVEATLHTADGEELVVEVNLTLLPMEDGEFQGTVGVVRDVTERKEREEALERYETVVEASGDGVYTLDAEGRYTFMNRANADILGRRSDELLGEHVSTVMDDEDVSKAEGLIRDLLENDRDHDTLELDVIDADGGRVTTETHIGLLPSDDGEFRGTVGFVRDIAERKERERALERYETLVETSGDAMYALDGTGHYTFVNEALAELRGYEKDDLMGEPVSIVLDEEDQERGTALIRELLADDDRQSGTFEMDVVTRDGDLIPVENHVTLLPNEAGEFRGTVGVLRDISERKEREEALRRQNERLDRFASMVSHDLRNPLNVAAGRVQMEHRETDSDNLARALEALLRMDDIVDDVLSLAREGQEVVDPDRVPFRPCVDAAWGTVDAPSASLSVHGAPGALVADESRLQQLLENLFRNAVEHGGDDVTVEVGRLGGDARAADSSTSSAGRADGFYVEDDGPGIPEGEREGIFKFGTSGAGDGTGFGLAIVESIAEAHGWAVALGDGEADGARFEVTGVEWVDGG